MRGALAWIFASAVVLYGAQLSAAPRKPPRATHQPAHVIPTKGTLSSADLLAIAVIALTKRGDAFSADPATQYVGRKFRIIQYVKSPDSRDGNVDGYWQYDLEAQSIAFSVRGSAYHVMYRSDRVGSSIGQNAFGVKVRITLYRATEVVVAPTAGSVLSSYAPLKATIPADPATGRRLSQTTNLIVEGEIVADRGKVASCVSNDDTATIDDPVEEVTTTCRINARVDRVAFVDATSGAVLSETSATADASVTSSVEVGAPTARPATGGAVGPMVDNPDWIRLPDADDYLDYYPERASRMSIGGRVTLGCLVSDAGTLSCSVTSEAPGDQGFGAAALKISKLFKMKPVSRDGRPVGGGHIRLPIVFQPPSQ